MMNTERYNIAHAAAVDNADEKLKHLPPYISSWADYDCGLISGFITGVGYADENPNYDMIKHIMLFAIQKTNMLLADDVDNEVNWKLLIDAAIKDFNSK